MSYRRNFCGGVASPIKTPYKNKKGPSHGEKVAKRSLHGEKTYHKENNVAKRSQHGEQVAKRPPNNEIKFIFFQGEGGQALSLSPMRVSMSIDLFHRQCLCYQLQSVEQNMYVLP